VAFPRVGLLKGMAFPFCLFALLPTARLL